MKEKTGERQMKITMTMDELETIHLHLAKKLANYESCYTSFVDSNDKKRAKMALNGIKELKPIVASLRDQQCLTGSTDN